MKSWRGGKLIASLVSLGAVVGCTTSHGAVKLEGALDYAPDGERVLVKAEEGISLYDVGKRRVVWERRPASPGKPLSATFSRNGAFAVLFQAHENPDRAEGTVSVIAMDSGLPVGATFIAQGSITEGLDWGQAAISDDGRWLASGLDYVSFQILANDSRRSALQLDAFRAAGIEFSPGAAPLRVSAVALYRQGGPTVGVFEFTDAWRNIALLPGEGARWVGSRLVLSRGASLDVWDGATRSPLLTLERADTPPNQLVKPLDHARSLLGVAEGARLRVVDVGAGRVVFERNTFGQVLDVEIRGDRLIVCFRQDREGRLQQYSLADGALLRSDDLGAMTRFAPSGPFYGATDRDEVNFFARLLPGGRYLDKVRDDDTDHTITPIAP